MTRPCSLISFEMPFVLDMTGCPPTCTFVQTSPTGWRAMVGETRRNSLADGGKVLMGLEINTDGIPSVHRSNEPHQVCIYV